MGLVSGCRRAVSGRGNGARVGNRGSTHRSEGEHPDAWRYRLHLGHGLPFVLPAIEAPRSGAWWCALVEEPAGRVARDAKCGVTEAQMDFNDTAEEAAFP